MQQCTSVVQGATAYLTFSTLAKTGYQTVFLKDSAYSVTLSQLVSIRAVIENDARLHTYVISSSLWVLFTIEHFRYGVMIAFLLYTIISFSLKKSKAFDSLLHVLLSSV